MSEILGLPAAEVIGYVIAGLEQRSAELQRRIDDCARQLGKRGASQRVYGALGRSLPAKTGHKISPEGRERIAAAQQARWAKVHKEQRAAERAKEAAKAERAASRSKPRKNAAQAGRKRGKWVPLPPPEPVSDTAPE